MATELEEVSPLSTAAAYLVSHASQLVGFIAHSNPQIRQIAVENLAPYSTAQPSIFKSDQLLPIKNLKLLVRDHPVCQSRNKDASV